VKAIPTGSRLLDEPYMQARPQKAEEYGLAALNRARDGVMGTTAVHICFGYAAIIHERPSGYSFLIQLKNCSCCQVSIETAPIQARLLKYFPNSAARKSYSASSTFLT